MTNQRTSRGTEVELEANTQLAGFLIEKKLGVGSMGTVYKALQLSLDRPVAIKILAPNLAANEAYVARFLKEARMVAKIHHPNVTSAFDVGEAEGYRFFVMEYVQGRSIRFLLDRGGAMAAERVVRIARQICEALRRAHELDLVHRDIKPDNILVTTDGVAKLCDLGLAQDGPEEGRSMGTPAYISPEQARGESHVDIRSDLYSMGATLYHMLTGQPPFDGRPEAVMALHLSEHPVPIPELNPDVPGGLVRVVERAMQKSRADRYQKPTELEEALRVSLEPDAEPAPAAGAPGAEAAGSSSAPTSRRRRRRRR